MATPSIKGTFTTIRWGTSVASQATPFSTAIIKSIKASRLGGTNYFFVEDKMKFVISLFLTLIALLVNGCTIGYDSAHKHQVYDEFYGEWVTNNTTHSWYIK